MTETKKRKQNLAAIDAWQAENVERITVKPRREDRISEQIQTLIDRGIAKSRQDYIINAVKVALANDMRKLAEDDSLGKPNDDIGKPIKNIPTTPEELMAQAAEAEKRREEEDAAAEQRNRARGRTLEKAKRTTSADYGQAEVDSYNNGDY